MISNRCLFLYTKANLSRFRSYLYTLQVFIAMQEATNFLETRTSADWSKIVSMAAKSDCQLCKQHGKIHESTPKN